MDIPIELIADIGFMGFVTIYLLYERTKSTQKMVKALENNTVALEGLKTVVDQCKKS